MYRYGRFGSLDNDNYLNSREPSVGLYRFGHFVPFGADWRRRRNRYREYEHFSHSCSNRGTLHERSYPGKCSGLAAYLVSIVGDDERWGEVGLTASVGTVPQQGRP